MKGVSTRWLGSRKSGLFTHKARPGRVAGARSANIFSVWNGSDESNGHRYHNSNTNPYTVLCLDTPSSISHRYQRLNCRSGFINEGHMGALFAVVYTSLHPNFAS